jgi:hypothetical protein
MGSGWDEAERDRVHAVARILRGQPLAFKHMTQMGTARGAPDLCAAPVGVERPLHGSRDFVIKTRPAARRLKLVGRPIEWSAAPLADVCPSRLAVDILAGKRDLSSLMDNDPFFFRSQRLERHRRACPLRPTPALAFHVFAGADASASRAFNLHHRPYDDGGPWLRASSLAAR